MSHVDDKQVAIWLLVCCALVFSMVVLGGVTRLTQSGLSMVEWEPIMGVVPPLSEFEWREVFTKYQASPEYQLVNEGMSLGEFKGIFYIEYTHRMLGRLIGVVFVFPFLWFFVTRRLRPGLAPKLLFALFLGGMQGLLGWYMVKSGLVHEPHVSPYRLSAHLGLAVFIYGFMFWIALDLFGKSESSNHAGVNEITGRYKILGLIALGVLGIMIITGGFVAGTKAGFAFNTFPKMYDRWIPEGMWALQPVWRNLFENIATVQFVHRCMALVVVLVFSWLCVGSIRRTQTLAPRLVAHSVMVLLGVQIILGILTLLYVVPVPLAVAHQAGALLLLTVLLVFIHKLYQPSSRARRPDWADT